MFEIRLLSKKNDLLGHREHSDSILGDSAQLALHDHVHGLLLDLKRGFESRTRSRKKQKRAREAGGN